MGEKLSRETPHDALIAALEKVEQMGKVVIIWEAPEGFKCGALDNDLTVADVIYLCEMYKAWLMKHIFEEAD